MVPSSTISSPNDAAELIKKLNVSYVFVIGNQSKLGGIISVMNNLTLPEENKNLFVRVFDPKDSAGEFNNVLKAFGDSSSSILIMNTRDHEPLIQSSVPRGSYIREIKIDSSSLGSAPLAAYEKAMILDLRDEVIKGVSYPSNPAAGSAYQQFVNEFGMADFLAAGNNIKNEIKLYVNYMDNGKKANLYLVGSENFIPFWIKKDPTGGGDGDSDWIATDYDYYHISNDLIIGGRMPLRGENNVDYLARALKFKDIPVNNRGDWEKRVLGVGIYGVQNYHNWAAMSDPWWVEGVVTDVEYLNGNSLSYTYLFEDPKGHNCTSNGWCPQVRRLGGVALLFWREAFIEDFGYSTVPNRSAYSDLIDTNLIPELDKKNGGYGIILYSGHGSLNEWSMDTCNGGRCPGDNRTAGQKEFKSEEIPAIKPSFVFASACQTGAIWYRESYKQNKTVMYKDINIARSFLEKGAMVYIGSTALSYLEGDTVRELTLKQTKDNKLLIGYAFKQSLNSIAGLYEGSTEEKARYEFNLFGLGSVEIDPAASEKTVEFGNPVYEPTTGKWRLNITVEIPDPIEYFDENGSVTEIELTSLVKKFSNGTYPAIPFDVFDYQLPLGANISNISLSSTIVYKTYNFSLYTSTSRSKKYYLYNNVTNETNELYNGSTYPDALYDYRVDYGPLTFTNYITGTVFALQVDGINNKTTVYDKIVLTMTYATPFEINESHNVTDVSGNSGITVNASFKTADGNNYTVTPVFRVESEGGLILDEDVKNETNITNILHTENFEAKGLPDGIHTGHIILFKNGTWLSEYSFTFSSGSPIIISETPQNASTLSARTKNTTISIETNEIAECRYSNTSGKPFTNMTLFSITNSTTHNMTVFNLSMGAYGYYVKCRDAFNNTNSEDYQISFIIPENRHPVLSPISDIIVNENETVKITLSASDPDGDPLTFFTWDSRFTNNSNNFIWVTNYTSAGTYAVRFYVTDGYVNVSQFAMIYVNNVNRIPAISFIGNQILTQGVYYSYHVNATDPDTDDTLYYYDNTTMFEINPYTGNISFMPRNKDVGNHSVEFTVSDGFSDVSIIVNYTINNVNDTPVMEFIMPQIVVENTTFTYQVIASDAENDTLTFSDNTPLFNIHEFLQDF